VAPQGAPSPFQTSPVSKSRFTRQYPCEPRIQYKRLSRSSHDRGAPPARQHECTAYTRIYIATAAQPPPAKARAKR
jgi:hypothetical protein